MVGVLGYKASSVRGMMIITMVTDNDVALVRYLLYILVSAKNYIFNV